MYGKKSVESVQYGPDNLKPHSSQEAKQHGWVEVGLVTSQSPDHTYSHSHVITSSSPELRLIVNTSQHGHTVKRGWKNTNCRNVVT